MGNSSSDCKNVKKVMKDGNEDFEEGISMKTEDPNNMSDWPDHERQQGSPQVDWPQCHYDLNHYVFTKTHCTLDYPIQTPSYLFYHTYFNSVEQINLKTLVNILVYEDLAPYDITSQLISQSKFILADIKHHLFQEFNKNGNGHISKTELFELISRIQDDKLFFEKTDLQVNQDLYTKNYMYDNIMYLYNKFIKDLASVGVDYTEAEPTIEALKTYMELNYKLGNVRTITKERELLVGSEGSAQWFGFKKYNNGHYYGYFNDNKREGYGIYQFYEERQSHFGWWQDSKLARNIVLKFHLDAATISEIWVGNLNASVQLEGYSSLAILNPDQTTKWSKEGAIAEGKVNGYGLYKYSNGDQLRGFMKKDKRDGFSMYYWTSGSQYTGYWKHGFRDGYGEYYYDSKDLYKGYWKRGCFDGWGYYEWAFKNDKYEGEWKNHVREGYGRYVYEDGKVDEGIFKNNQLVVKVVDKNMAHKFKLLKRTYGSDINTNSSTSTNINPNTNSKFSTDNTQNNKDSTATVNQVNTHLPEQSEEDKQNKG